MRPTVTDGLAWLLPVTVDPYAVTARLERDGVLVIEAPVIVL